MAEEAAAVVSSGSGLGFIPILGIGLSAISVGANIIQGIEARKAQRSAERAAEDALAAAKRKLSVDRFEGLQIPMEAYEMAQQAGVAQQKQALTALQESGPRGLASGVGRVSAAGLQAAEQQRQQIAQDMFELEKLQAQEAAKRDVVLSDLNLSEATGAQTAALAAEQQAAAAFTGAAQTAAKAGMDIYKTSALYGTDFAGRQAKAALDKGLITQEQVADYVGFVSAFPRGSFKNLSQEQAIQGFQDYLSTAEANKLSYTPSSQSLSPNATSGLTYTPTATLPEIPNMVPDQFGGFGFETLPQ